MNIDLIILIGAASFIVILITLLKLSKQLDNVSGTIESLTKNVLSIRQQDELNASRITQRLDYRAKDIITEIKSRKEKDKDEEIREQRRTRDL